MEKAVFLDRDGVIIEDVGYIGQVDRVRFLPGACKAIKLLNENGFRTIVITNQAGVARGYFDEEAVKKVNLYIQKSLSNEGAFIDRFYYCPHHVDGIIEKYRKDCYWRKPNPGMIEEAVRDFDINLKRSFTIGDKDIDIEAGQRAGCKTILLTGGDNPDSEKKSPLASDYIAPNLYESARWLVQIGCQEG